MTDDEWSGIAFLLENAWPGDFDDNRRAAYRVFLGDYEPAQVVLAIKKLSHGGGRFMPSAAEIVKAVDDLQEQTPPDFSIAYRWLVKAIRRGSRLGGPFSARERAAVAFLEEHDMAIVGRFMQAETYQKLALTEFDDPEYGAVRLRELEFRWKEFVGVAKERMERGLALGEGRGGGPRRLSEFALPPGTVEAPDKPRELPSGE